MARTLPLMLSYYHLQAPFVNESYTKFLQENFAESFYLARKAKQKRERSVFFVQIHYMQSVNLLLHLLSRPSLRTQHSSLLVKIFYPRNKIEFIIGGPVHFPLGMLLAIPPEGEKGSMAPGIQFTPRKSNDVASLT